MPIADFEIAKLLLILKILYRFSAVKEP